MSTKKLFKFDGHDPDANVTSVFVAYQEEVDHLIGKDANFGYIDVFGDPLLWIFANYEFTVLSDDPFVVVAMEKALAPSGFVGINVLGSVR